MVFVDTSQTQNTASVNASAANFMEEVIDASQKIPVIVNFWAPSSELCKQLTPLLEDAVNKAAGAVKLVKVNIDEAGNNEIAAQLRVQSVPTVYAFVGGQPVDGFSGPQPESAIKDFVDRLKAQSGGGGEDAGALLEQAEAAIGSKDFATAATLFQQVLGLRPEEDAAMAGMVRCLIGMAEYEAAREMIDSMTDEMRMKESVQQVEQMLKVAQEASASAGNLAEFEARVSANPKDPEAQYNLAMALYGSGRTNEAMDTLLESMRIDRDWNEGVARTQLLEIFNTLGAAAPEVADARRKLSSLLFS